eukprot:CAMPEP_0172900506 /NCGR_PEP_ID=MMETSP1075-20121228/164234_1 /TAXON_ID=2916 /ORGANISM="Ceratium fusus, Strain PA161109" /LENGTH=88 /DNA_ID=CAMNT_0013756697 /DNA_START=10 /DNA_END=273 /DNA_ORIENTATION=-
MTVCINMERVLAPSPPVAKESGKNSEFRTCNKRGAAIQEANSRADIHSLGLTIHFKVTGHALVKTAVAVAALGSAEGFHTPMAGDSDW